MQWTARDREAWKLVEARAKNTTGIDADTMTDMMFYTKIDQDMAHELAAFYHPRAGDPVGGLTIPEILSVVELASGDLHEMVIEHMPAGHLLTINDLRQARKFVDWYQ